MTARVAIYGGAFDPPHLAHLFAVTWLLSRDDVEAVWVLPTANHVFGKRMAPFEARCALLESALAPFGDRIRVCRIEAEREGRSRTYDTLEALSRRYPERAFGLVIGADNLTERHRWHRFDDLVARWPVWVLGRPGHEGALRSLADAPWCRPGPTLPDVSSTALRAALAGGGSDAALAWLPQTIHEAARPLYAPRASVGRGVGVLGHGRAGAALAAGLRAAGWPVWTWNRSGHHAADLTGDLPARLAETPIWLLAVSDDAVGPFAERLAAHPAASQRPTVLHCAGRLGAEALAPLAAVGAKTGSLHPLQSLRGAESAGSLRGAYCACEGEAADAAVELVEAFGGHAVRLPVGEKAAYHAAAVFSANFVTTLNAGGVTLLRALGVEPDVARRMLLPLLQGTVDHLGEVPAEDALTGPFARGDLQAIAAHQQAIARKAPHLLDAYAALARATAGWLDWPPDRVAALERALGTDP